MSQLQAILNYQEIDTKLYKLERDLAGCEERKEYVKYKKFLETAPEKLDALEVKATALKTEAAELSKKYLQVEGTLKDFENLDELVTGGADIAFYKKKAQSIVEQLKKLKADLAALTNNIKTTDAEYQKLKKQVLAAQKQYAEAAEKYNAVKASREAERKEIDAKLSEIEKNIPALANASRLFDKGYDNEKIANIALEGVEFDIFDELEVEYKCTCSRERVSDALHSLGKKELYKMLDEQLAEGKDESLEVLCKFCDKKEVFTKKDIDKLFEE